MIRMELLDREDLLKCDMGYMWEQDKKLKKTQSDETSQNTVFCRDR